MPPHVILQKRAWRLAYLLSSGDPGAATRIVRSVLRAQPDLSAIDAAHLERLVILRARVQTRSRRPSTSDIPHPAPDLAPAFAALASLPFQAREAWCLGRIDGFDLHRVSRAMDCSTTAIQRHLERADELMLAALGPGLPAAVAALNAHTDSLDPAPLIAAHRQREQRSRVRRLLIFIALALLALMLALTLMR